MREMSRKMALLALRSPALLVSLVIVHGDCSNVTQTLLRFIKDAGLSSNAWPCIVTDFPECFGRQVAATNCFAVDERSDILHDWLAIFSLKI